MDKQAIAIFVSGRGSNAKAIINQQQNLSYKVALLVVSSKKAKAIDLAKSNEIPFIILEKDTFFKKDYTLLNTLKQHHISLIVLAGFLWKIPNYLIDTYLDKIVNIHPALLPKYGGKGMYGMHIHEAVFKQKEVQTGITIHLVNEQYDKGEILVQKTIEISKNDTPELIANKVLMLEHEYYAQTIDTYLKKIHK